MPFRLFTSPGDFDFGDRGDNSDTEDTFNIHGGQYEHPEGDIPGDLGRMFDELLLICAHIL